jgi:hypothetical protein
MALASLYSQRNYGSRRMQSSRHRLLILPRQVPIWAFAWESGFGPDWECANVPHVICINRLPANPVRRAMPANLDAALGPVEFRTLPGAAEDISFKLPAKLND